MGWLDKLAGELSSQLNQPVTTGDLARQFQQFTAQCDDPYLRRSYPTDLHHFRRASQPQAATIDIILSFMDWQYPNIHVPLVVELTQLIAERVKTGSDDSEIDRVLRIERLRRHSKGSRENETYWGFNRSRLAKKYAGLFALMFVDSMGGFRIELFALSIKQADPTKLTAYWQFGDQLQVGDVLTNTYRLSATMVSSSTNRIIDPIFLSLMRAPRINRQKGDRRLILGGVAVGTKSHDIALYHCRIALLKLEHVPVANIVDFSKLASSTRTNEVLSTLGRQAQQRRVLDFLNSSNQAMRPLDAAEALGDLDRSTIAI
jgi:hypothetical protein